jgi:hypothetical protein
VRIEWTVEIKVGDAVGHIKIGDKLGYDDKGCGDDGGIDDVTTGGFEGYATLATWMKLLQFHLERSSST